MSKILRGMAVAVLTGLALLAGATPAFAHAQFKGSDPADGASLDHGPAQVTLTFTDQMQPGFNTVTVVGPDGVQYQSGGVKAAGTSVSVAVKDLGPAGRYTIGYRVLSDDGHPVTGSVSFTLTQPGPAAAAAAPPSAAGAAPAPAVAETAVPTTPTAGTPAEPDGPAVWPWIAGGVVLVGLGGLVAFRLGRGGSATTASGGGAGSPTSKS